MDSAMTTSSKLGTDLLLEVLSASPPKALMRFKCVSKWWDHLITSPEFTAKHLSKANLSSNTTSVLFNRLERVHKPEDEGCLSRKLTEDDNVWTLCFLHFRVGNDNSNDADNNYGTFACNVEDIDVPTPMRAQYLHVTGHCDGIVCVQDLDFGKTFLWNPAIKQWRLLPPDPHIPNWDQRLFPATVGFGYDPKSDDYKVIDIIDEYHHETYGDPDDCEVFIYPQKVAVYTLGSDAWREIDTAGGLETETTNLWADRFQVYLKGMCYWLGHEQNKVMSEFDVARAPENVRDGVIIVFDTSYEVFHEMSLPDGCRQVSRYPELYDIRILVRDESIALSGVHAYEYPSHVGIWVMDKVRGGPTNAAWTKHLSLELNTMARPLAFWKSDEILMIKEFFSEYIPNVVSYNSCTNIYKRLTISGRTEKDPAFVYVWSTVPITGRIKASKLENNV